MKIIIYNENLDEIDEIRLEMVSIKPYIELIKEFGYVDSDMTTLKFSYALVHFNSTLLVYLEAVDD